jgi:hypothetical protein
MLRLMAAKARARSGRTRPLQRCPHARSRVSARAVFRPLRKSRGGGCGHATRLSVRGITNAQQGQRMSGGERRAAESQCVVRAGPPASRRGGVRVCHRRAPAQAAAYGSVVARRQAARVAAGKPVAAGDARRRRRVASCGARPRAAALAASVAHAAARSERGGGEGSGTGTHRPSRAGGRVGRELKQRRRRSGGGVVPALRPKVAL